MNSRLHLPIDDFEKQIRETFSQNQNLILTAEPGAGKTTRVPPWLASEVKGQVLVLEPRRLAAVAAADRIAQENGWVLGQEVGYQVRFDNRSKDSTRIVFLTEKLLTKKILQDPELKNVSVVVFDEFHERSLDADLALGHLRELQLLGHDIKIMVMSATLAVDRLESFFEKAPHVSVPGKLFPLTEKHGKTTQLLRLDDQFYKNMIDSIQETLKLCNRSLLVFLPGAGEIDRLAERLESHSELRQYSILKLHGSLKLEQQKAVLTPTPERRIILCTNIAESALTVDGVDGVVDSGLEKSAEFDLELGFGSLGLKRISQFSAKQRAGRSARQYPGTVFKVWTHLDERSMKTETPSALQREDLSEILLTLSFLGVNNWGQFTWFEHPGEKRLAAYSQRLQAMGLINADHQLTELGKTVIQWPLDVRSSLLLSQCEKHGVVELGIIASALLQEKDFLTPAHVHPNEDCDLLYRIDSFLDQRGGRAHYRIQQVERIAQQLSRYLKSSGDLFKTASDMLKNEKKRDEFKTAILLSSLDQLCRRRPQGLKGVRIDRKGMNLAPTSCAQNSDYFVVLSAFHLPSQVDLQVSLASGFETSIIKTQLKDRVTKRQNLVIDEDSKKIYLEENDFFFDLEIGQGPRKLASVEQVQQLLPDYVKNNWPRLESKIDSLRSLMQRIRFLETQTGTNILTDELKRKVSENVCFQAVQLSDIYERDWNYFLKQELSQEQNRKLEDIPASLEVPSGSRIEVNYEDPNSPFISVRLQELFGWLESPMILQKVKLKIELLGPNFRPVQITSDLRSFWENAYQEIRKELKIKYPKHSWPEDPKTAKAEAKGRRRT